jgi:hypothetical protein
VTNTPLEFVLLIGIVSAALAGALMLWAHAKSTTLEELTPKVLFLIGEGYDGVNTAPAMERILADTELVHHLVGHRDADPLGFRTYCDSHFGHELRVCFEAL